VSRYALSAAARPVSWRRLVTRTTQAARANERVDRRQLAVYAGLAALSALVAAGGTWWAVRAATRGQLTIGDLTMLIAALAAVASTLTSIITSAAVTYQSLLMFASFREVVTQEPDLPLPPHPVQAGPLRRGIELRDVWFRYGPDQPWILRGVSLLIPRGQALALVGHNGAGKSTLVKLLCRFYDPDRGAILWDGTDLRELDLGQLRDRVSVVFQDYMSYELSAADNIAVGDLAQQRPALVAAARRAGIHQVLETLPKGYDTLLTRSYYDLSDADDPQAGVLLSGGQWQRLALARAFLRADRDLAVLDEPSAGLDAEAEHQLQGSLRADRRGRTTLLISHRLNTVRDADQIVVLSDGVVAEQGGHDVLMARGGIYARLFSLQAQGYTGGPAAGVAPSAILSGSGHD
jgi:ATP-binding cassette subfamily B protein